MFGCGISGAGQNPPSGMISSPGRIRCCTAALSDSATSLLRPRASRRADAPPPGVCPAQGARPPCDTIPPDLRNAVIPRLASDAGVHAQTAGGDLLHDLHRTAEDRLRPSVGVCP